jgi:hypothetical protein
MAHQIAKEVAPDIHFDLQAMEIRHSPTFGDGATI